MFNVTLTINIPGVLNGPFHLKAAAGLRSKFGDAVAGMTDKEVLEFATRVTVMQGYLHDIKTVDVPADTAADRATLDATRLLVKTLEADIKATELALQSQAISDWA